MNGNDANGGGIPEGGVPEGVPEDALIEIPLAGGPLDSKKASAPAAALKTGSIRVPDPDKSGLSYEYKAKQVVVQVPVIVWIFDGRTRPTISRI